MLFAVVAAYYAGRAHSLRPEPAASQETRLPKPDLIRSKTNTAGRLSLQPFAPVTYTLSSNSASAPKQEKYPQLLAAARDCQNVFINIQQRLNSFREDQARNAEIRQRQMLTGSPSDLLNIMAADQLSRRNGGRMPAGQFYALSPEVRGHVMMRPGDVFGVQHALGKELTPVLQRLRLNAQAALPHLKEKESAAIRGLLSALTDWHVTLLRGEPIDSATVERRFHETIAILK